MELWPSDHRPVKAQHKPSRKKEVNIKVQEAIEGVSPTGPLLYPGNGIISAAMPRVYRTLAASETTRLKWDFIAHQGSTIQTLGSPVTLFPERTQDMASKMRISEHRRAEEGARFLRQRYPDVDIPFEIIKESMEEDMVEVINYDKGSTFHNSLAMIRMGDTNANDGQTVFAFPMGDLGNELNISRSRWSRSKGLVFIANAQPVAKFDTPVLQIDATSIQNEEAAFLAIRTMSFCSLFSIAAGPSNRSHHSPFRLKQSTSIKAGDMGKIMDMAMSPFNPTQVLLVREFGDVAIMQAERDGIVEITQGSTRAADGTGGWHIGWANGTNSALRASTRKLDLLDIRTQGGLAKEGIRFGLEENITALEGYKGSAEMNTHQVLLTTNRRVVWVDTRHLKKPLLSWKHTRARDSTLRASSCTLGSDTVAILMSQRNGLIESYTASSGSDPIYSKGTGSVISTVPGNFQRIGYAFHRNQSSDRPAINMVELSARGGLFCSYVTLNSNMETSVAPEEDIKKEQLTPDWDEKVEDLASNLQDQKSEPLSMRESFEVNFEPIYRDVMQRAVSGLSADADLDKVRDMLDQMPRLWQETDHPIETIMTTYDIAFEASSEPDHMGRSVFLTESLLSSRRSNVAFQEGHFPRPDAIGKDSAWMFDLSPTIETIRELDDMIGNLGTGHPSHLDAERLQAMDAALYSHVYSSNHIATSDKYMHDDDSLERATELLSLAEARMPPPVSFSFLKPRPITDDITDISREIQEPKDTVGTIPDATLGTRLLLSEWELGADPRKFEYINPYPEVPTSTLDSTQSRLRLHAEQSRSQFVEPFGRSIEQSQIRPAPPKIGLSQSIAPVIISAGTPGRSMPKMATQKSDSVPGEPASQMKWQPTTPSIGLSQSTMPTSSQIQPSKLSTGAAKPSTKKVKKRMGGF